MALPSSQQCCKRVLQACSRMILYAVVLIVVMLFTWSPKVKEAMSVVTDKLAGAFKKKEAGSNE